MSKAEKLRGRLASIQKDREEFEKQRKELEAQMDIGRQNIGKIQKGLKQNVIVGSDSINLEAMQPIQQLSENLANSVNASQGNGNANKKLVKKDSRQANSASGILVPPSPMMQNGNNGFFPSNSNNMMNQSASTSGLPNNGNGNNHNSNNSNINAESSNNLNGLSVTGVNNANANQANAHKEMMNFHHITPTGPRVSDWCYTGAIDSQPPVVKSREMYENVRLLGRGAFGEVNLVKNIEDNKLFAIKTIFINNSSHSHHNEFDECMKEIKLLRITRHPCIIDIHDAFMTNTPKVVHIVMHYCESGTLATYISSAKKTKTSISEVTIVKWILQLTLAMQYLHAFQHVLHRDLKPMNILLTEGGDILKLSDFGLALQHQTHSHEGGGEASQGGAGGENNGANGGGDAHNDEAGTPYYTAPEIIQRESYSYPADCWSFGVILYQLLTLERPFDGSSTAELVKSILSHEPKEVPAHYSEDMRRICRDLLIKSPAERMTMTTLLAEPLLVPKIVAFPQNYRPKYLEERIRRSHIKQLEMQIESVLNMKGLGNRRASVAGGLTGGAPAPLMRGKSGNMPHSRNSSFNITSGVAPPPSDLSPGSLGIVGTHAPSRNASLSAQNSAKVQEALSSISEKFGADFNFENSGLEPIAEGMNTLTSATAASIGASGGDNEVTGAAMMVEQQDQQQEGTEEVSPGAQSSRKRIEISRAIQQDEDLQHQQQQEEQGILTEAVKEYAEAANAVEEEG